MINEDLRDVDVDFPWFRARGARFVRLTVDEAVRCARLGARHDLSTVLTSTTTLRLDEIKSDLAFDNSGDDLTVLHDVVVPAITRLIRP